MVEVVKETFDVRFHYVIIFPELEFDIQLVLTVSPLF